MNQEEKNFLENYDITQYERPSIAADIVLFALDSAKEAKKIGVGPLQILLIQRANYPFKDQWSLPGSFCIPTETVEDTARRALFEETGIRNAYIKMSNIYSEPDRDPRGWIMSSAFVGTCNKKDCELRSGRDAWKALWFDISMEEERKTYDTEDGKRATEITYHLHLTNSDENIELNEIVVETSVFNGLRTSRSCKTIKANLGFDHSRIIVESFSALRSGVKKDIRLIFELVPDTFTIGELQAAYKRVYGVTEPVANFTRTVTPYIEATDKKLINTGYRPATIYKRDPNAF